VRVKTFNIQTVPSLFLTIEQHEQNVTAKKLIV